MARRESEISIKSKEFINFLTKEQIAEYYKAFRLFDKNDDGYFSSKELGQLLRCLGENPTEKELVDLISEIDYSGDGKVEFNEFLLMMAKNYVTKEMPSDIHDAFRAFDKDGNGTISAWEFRDALTTIGETLSQSEIDEFFNDIDVDRNGQIDFQEFQKAILQ